MRGAGRDSTCQRQHSFSVCRLKTCLKRLSQNLWADTQLYYTLKRSSQSPLPFTGYLSNNQFNVTSQVTVSVSDNSLRAWLLLETHQAGSNWWFLSQLCHERWLGLCSPGPSAGKLRILFQNRFLKFAFISSSLLNWSYFFNYFIFCLTSCVLDLIYFYYSFLL